MRPGLGFGLLLAAAFTLSANAATVSAISITGNTSPGGSPFTANFTVGIDNSVAPGGFMYTFMDNNATVNGLPDPVTINVSQGLTPVGGQMTDTLEFADTTMGYDQFFTVFGNPDLFFDPSVPAFNPGTYSASDFACTSQVNMPGVSGTLAMFQATTCLTNLAVAVSTVTPEPSSIALFGTGFLGIAGIVRRRFHA